MSIVKLMRVFYFRILSDRVNWIKRKEVQDFFYKLFFEKEEDQWHSHDNK